MIFLTLVLALAAFVFLFPFLLGPQAYRNLFQPISFSQLWRDTSGQVQPGIMNNMLTERGGTCTQVRIPTGAYPVYSETIGGVLDAAGNATIAFEAQRDTLFVGLDAEISDAAPLTARISATVCNTKIMVRSAARQWVRCCDRKPIFLVGVPEDKELEFQITGGTPGGDFALTLHGFQGKGCCG